MRAAAVNPAMLQKLARSHKRMICVTRAISQPSATNQSQMPLFSQRIQDTDSPCIVKTKELVRSVDGCVSLAQGIVHWPPPQQAQERAASYASNSSVHSYGPDEGLPELREALKHKIKVENGLDGYDVMVTSGANQAFVNVVLALLDAESPVVLFAPYYFNHQMAIQMTGGGNSIVYGPCDKSTFHPDLDWLENRLQQQPPLRMVVLVNPNNPTGILMTQQELQRASDLCAAAGCWLVLDNTYEHFVYDGRKHSCIAAPHVINIFSFSKAFGMMGWRMGYICYPEDGTGALASQLLKAQDTIPICPPQLSQHVAMGALEAGREWVSQRVDELESNREALLDALSPLGSLGNGIAGGEGAIYLFAKLPHGCDNDDAVVEWLVKKHKVCLIPGSSCGCPGHIRAAYANLPPEKCKEAAGRLKVGLQELVDGGFAAVDEFLSQQ